MMTDYSSVDDLEKVVSEACKQLEKSQLQLHTAEQAETSLQSQVAALTAEVEHLWSCLQDLIYTHNEFTSQSMEQLETIDSLRIQLTHKTSNSEAILRLLRQLLLTLPTDFHHYLKVDNTLNHFFCCTPDDDTSTFPRRADLLPNFFQSDKYPTPRYPLVQATGVVTSVTLTKRTLTTPDLSQVYDRYGLEGLRYLLQNTLRCPQCSTMGNSPTAPDGFRAHQGRLEYP